MSSRKRLYGAEYKKIRENKQNVINKQAGSFTKFLLKHPMDDIQQLINNSSQTTTTGLTITSSQDTQSNYNLNCLPSTSRGISENSLHRIEVDLFSDSDRDSIDSDSFDFEEINNISDKDVMETNREHSSEISGDPSDWPLQLTNSIRILFIKKGPMQIKKFDFPKNQLNRKFFSSYYQRVLHNGEQLERSWLVYSKKNDTVFCFCCRMFSSKLSDSGVVSEFGYNDWKNLSGHLKIHETSKTHIIHFSSWQEMIVRLKLNQTIDSQNQRIIESEINHWRSVLFRLCAILRCMAAQHFSIRGRSSTIHSPHNGIFLKIIELFSLFDNVLKTHVERIQNKHLHVHYLGPQIQNELINLMSEKVKNNILSRVRDAKYYSIILDCTPDCSHKEQMSIILRYVCISKGIVHEHFIGFIVLDKTGAGLSDQIIKMLSDLEININYMRGQSYDNGSNMRGKHNGVQKRILDINPRAFYVPCNSHSLNLVVNDAAKCNIYTISFFNIVQQLYVFFSASTERWKILIKFLPKLTLKKVCDTRWESRINAIRPIRYQFEELYNALSYIKDDINLTGTHGLQTKAYVLLKNICDFKFICSIIIWYDVLSIVNPVSKQLQSIQYDIQISVKSLSEIIEFLKEYRRNGFFKVKLAAKEIASVIGISEEFPQDHQVRKRLKKTNFSYKNKDDSPLHNPEKKFEVDFFNTFIDMAINSLQDRFIQLNNHCSNFGFLYDINILKSWEHETIQSIAKI